MPTRCLLLACGNPLRGDDGVGIALAEWAEAQFGNEPGVRVLARQQWTPELAYEVAQSETVLFLDGSLESLPGAIEVCALTEAESVAAIPGHHLGAPQLLGLARALYGAAPPTTLLLTVGMGSTELGEGFSAAVEAALPEACRRVEEAVRQLLQASTVS